MSRTIEALLIKLDAKTDTLRREMDKVNSSVKRSARSMKQELSAAEKGFMGLNRAAGSVTRTIAGLTAGFGAVAGIRGIVSTISSFEKSMSGVQAVTRSTADQMKELEKVARELGASTRFSAAEAADGMKFLGMAGFDTQQIIEAIPATLNLAAAGALELAEAADIASNVLTGMRMTADETERVVDVLAYTAANSNTSVLQLGEAFSYVASGAAAFGLSVEETSAFLGILGNAGIQASSAGTGLGRVLAQLATPTDDAKAAIRGLGIAIEDVSPETNTLAEIVNTFAKAGLGAADSIRIFGQLGYRSMLALTSQNSELQEMVGAMQGVDGVAQEMSDTMGNNLSGGMQKLTSALSELALKIGDSGLLGWMASVVELATEGVSAIGEFADTINNKIVQNGLDDVIRQREELLEQQARLEASPVYQIGIGRGAGRIQDELDAITQQLQALDEKEAGYRKIIEVVTEADKSIAAYAKSQSSLKKSFDAGVITLEEYTDALIESQNAADGFSKSLGQSAKAAEQQEQKQRALAKQAQALADAEKDRLATLDKLQAKYDQTFSDLQQYSQAQGELKTLYDDGRISLEEYTDALINQQNQLNGMDGSFETVAESVKKVAEEADPMAVAFEEAIRRIDGSFIDMWENILSGSKSTFDSIKSALRSLGAEILHSSFTRPLIGGLGLTAGGTASASTAAGGAGGMDLFSNLGSLFGGNSIGMAISDGLAGLGSSSLFAGTGTGNALVGAAGNAGAYGNLAYGGTGLIAGLLGDKIFGGMGGTGSSLGATAGLAIGGPIGAAIGGLLGGALGGLFGNGKPSNKAQRVDLDFSDGSVFASGQTGKKFSQENRDAADAIGEIVSSFGAYAKEVTGTAAESFRVIVGNRDGLLLTAVGEHRGEEFETLDDLTAGAIRRILDDIADEMSDGLRAMALVITGNAEEMVAAGTGLLQIQQQLDADVFADYTRMAELSGRTLTEVWRDQSNAVRDLANDLDASAASINGLAGANAARMQMELQMLAMLDQASASINQTLGNTIEQITLSLLDQEGQYDRLSGQAEALAASLNMMSDPARIAQTVQEIDRLTNSAYGLLDESQRADMGQEFISFLEEVQTLADSRLDATRQDVVDESAALRDVIDTAMGAAADRFTSAANAMAAAAATMQGAANSIPRTINVNLPGFGLSEVNG